MKMNFFACSVAQAKFDKGYRLSRIANCAHEMRENELAIMLAQGAEQRMNEAFQMEADFRRVPLAELRAQTPLSANIVDLFTAKTADAKGGAGTVVDFATYKLAR